MELNVTSEIGRLKSVLVHLPGREIDLMVPPMMAQLLFDDILYGQVAREEHRRFQQLLRFVAEEVVELQDLLEEVFEDETVKADVVHDLARRNRFGRKIVKRLLDCPAAELADVLISGIPSESEESGELPKFDLFPVPNLFFMRDPQVVIGDRVVISAMATQARRRESLLSKYVFEHHPRFQGRDVFWADLMKPMPERPLNRKPPTLEGGDILVASRDALIIGMTERTNRAGVERVIESLRESDSGVRTVVIVEMPKQRSFMHLDTVFTVLSRDECLVYGPMILPDGAEEADVYECDLTKREITWTTEKDLLSALRSQKMDLKPIRCGGDDPIAERREQWTDGANAFAMAPGALLIYDRNERTAEELSRAGYRVVDEADLLLGKTDLQLSKKKKYVIRLAAHELSRARGGPRCMAMPLSRDDVGP